MTMFGSPTRWLGHPTGWPWRWPKRPAAVAAPAARKGWRRWPHRPILRRPVAVTTHPQALKRVVMNLVDNALKFAGEAQVVVSQTDAALVIDVLDRGPGMPEDQLLAVLQPFYRLEGSRNRETGGSGLGLAIAHRLSGALGATLSLHKRPGGGLQARLALP
ncbi:MAG: ATP-binding protein, partial [Massilia sp.]|nr:ATP-binding protein [Aquabacterium sp.]